MKLHYRPELKKIGRNLRSSGNLAEALLWRELKAKKLGAQFLRQRPISDYVVDFYCEKLSLAIEIDGASHDTKVEKDVVRQNVLEQQGILVLRFLDSDVRHNMDSVIGAIEEGIKSSGLADSATSFSKGGTKSSGLADSATSFSKGGTKSSVR